MAYKLTLTLDERRAIDWIGDRYSNGYTLWRLLWLDSLCVPEDAEWDGPDDITFNVPESVAWQICENADSEEGRFPCFAFELRGKMETFCERVV